MNPDPVSARNELVRTWTDLVATSPDLVWKNPDRVAIIPDSVLTRGGLVPILRDRFPVFPHPVLI